jgi:hypothetical protein
VVGGLVVAAKAPDNEPITLRIIAHLWASDETKDLQFQNTGAFELNRDSE